MAPAGYSGKPLSAKLGLKPGQRVQLRGAPRRFREQLRPVPEGVRFVGLTARAPDCILLFAPSAAILTDGFRSAAAVLPPAGTLWVAWPKKASKAPTDLTESGVRRIGLASGLVDVKVCAIDDVWSGLKFVRRLRDR